MFLKMRKKTTHITTYPMTIKHLHSGRYFVYNSIMRQNLLHNTMPIHKNTTQKLQLSATFNLFSPSANTTYNLIF